MAFTPLCSVLQDVCQMVVSDLTGKNTALVIDKECHQLENTSNTISIRKDPTRIMRGIVTVDAWDSFSSHNKYKANEEVKFSVRLREAMNHTVLQVRGLHNTNQLESTIAMCTGVQRSTHHFGVTIEMHFKCVSKQCCSNLLRMLITIENF